jgi:hypothetical protein
MRVREIFEQQMPTAAVGIPSGVEAARRAAGGHRRREVAVERDLVPAARPGSARAIGQTRFQDKGGGRAVSRAGISEPQPEDMGQHGRERRLDRDVGHASPIDGAAFPKGLGETGRPGGAGQQGIRHVPL